MTAVLKSSGFKNLESLQEFCNRFPHISGCLDEDLEKIWICHKNPEDIPVVEEINLLPSKDYCFLSKIIQKKIAAGKLFCSLLTEFSAFSIFCKIYSQFDKQLTNYLFTKCYLLYNWGINAFEPVIDHFEIHSIIQERQKQPFECNKRKIGCGFFSKEFVKNIVMNNTNINKRKKSVDFFEEELSASDSSKNKSKLITLKAVEEASKKAKKFYEFSKNSRNPYQEMFSLKKILYDKKQRAKWPKKHILSKNNAEDLILFIIQIPVVSNFPLEEKFLIDYKNWVLLRELLEKFVKNHNKMNENGGYGKILKKHLKSVKAIPGRRLNPIPKTSICSYVLDLLRKVLPIELFGWNRVRKQFFSRLIKVIKGNKGENFLWYSLLQFLLIKKSDLLWCSQIGDNYSQTQMILKLFKFIIIHYVFVVLKNNFYITETGSSNFGLKYYMKNDMESASDVFINNLLKFGHIEPLNQKDCNAFTIERKWLDTGVIAKEDLREKLKTRMNPDEEYQQPIAHVRFLPKNEGSDELRIITHILKNATTNSLLNSGSKKLNKYFADRLSHRKKNLFFVKLFLEFLVDKIGFGIRPLPSNPKLAATWKKALHLKEKCGKLFFVKADISDAFDSVKYNTLTEILRRAIEKESEVGKVQLKKIIEWKWTNYKIQKVVRFSFSNRPKENSVMINRSFYLYQNKKINKYIDLKFLRIIKQVVMQQKMKINGKIFKLTKGLAQGSAGMFSSQLCEIYYSFLDNLYFKKFIESNDSVLLRAVDDYLFITSDVEKAKEFLELVQHGFTDFGVRFNNHKLKSNLIENIQEVTYLGLAFNFDDMSVKPNYSSYQKNNLLSTIKMVDKCGSNHFSKQIFLQRRSLQMKCLKLHSIVINSTHNTLKIIRQTVFKACLMQSLRIISLADYLYSDGIKDDSEVYRILLISCRKMKNLVASCGLSAEEINWLFFYAALNILRKFSGQFKLLFLMVRFRTQKCEKAFSENGAQLLLNLLKDDIFEGSFWEKLKGIFKELGKQALKTL